MEKNYDFRQRHWQVHKPDRRLADRKKLDSEIMIENGWSIGGDWAAVSKNAVDDFMDYLWVSMKVAVTRTAQKQARTVWFTEDTTLDKGFRLEVTDDGVVVALAKDEDAFRAVVYLEDIMNLEGAPVLEKGTAVRRPMFKWRSVHSGCGIDEFPVEELRAVVHAGYDAIVIFVKAFDQVSTRYCTINETIKAAKNFGIQTFLYNYMPTFIHPDDPDADAMFDSVYGELFNRYPDASGIHMCGESLEFPSKDPHTTGKLYSQSVTDGIPDTRPSPGWYPCEDYPAFLDKIQKAIRKVKPDAEVVFSTYNWSYQPEDKRREFLEKLPKGYRLIIAYDIRAERTNEGMNTPVMDYTMSQAVPGGYFETECRNCHELGIPIEGNVNTAGQAWDFGVVPYVPAPDKLITRLLNVRRAHDEYGLDGCYATHHYGYWNCVASDLGKWSSWEDFVPDYDRLLEKIAVRDYGRKDAPHVLAAWKLWGLAMDHYVASNEDQYGPWRVGASYPFIFQPNITLTMLGKEISFPTDPHAHFGYQIIKTLYQPYENINQAPGFLRYPADLRRLAVMLDYWNQGMAEIEKIGDYDEAQRIRALGTFIRCSVKTVMNIKRWWLANMKLQTSENTTQALEMLDEIEAIGNEERENVKDAYRAVNTDSRIGWEPSMEYVTDEWHLDWKLRQMDSAYREIASYRQMVLDARKAGK